MAIFPGVGRMARDVALRLRGGAAPREQRLLFAFAGGSGAWPGMGRELYRCNAVFREAVDASVRVVEEVLGWSPAAPFRGGQDPPATPEVERRNAIIQLGVLQIAQVDLWREEGVTPGGVVAVSLGEMIAPYAAGALSRDDCARVVAVVSHAISRTRSREWMFLLNTDPATARRLCRTASAPLDYLGATAPLRTAVLGRESDADALRAFLGDSVSREIPSEWSYHTPRLDVDRAWMEEQLRGLVQARPTCPIYSAAAGGPIPVGAPFDARFFAWMVSRPFHFTDAVSAALDGGFDVVLNIGADTSTGAQVVETARTRGGEVRFIDSLHPDTRGDEVGAWRKARTAAPPVRGGTRVERAPTDARTLDLSDPGTGRRIFEVYEELRAAGSVHFLERHNRWILLGYDDVSRALAEPQRFSSRTPGIECADPFLLGSDPPEHTAVRRIVAQCFSARDSARRAGIAEQLVQSLLRPLEEGRELDVVEGLARPLAMAMGADLVGLDRDEVVPFADAAHVAQGSMVRLYQELEAPLGAVMHRSGLYQWLRSAAGGSMDDRVARSLVRTLWVAGTETLPRVVSSAVFLLLGHEELRDRIAADPEMLAPFVSEVLRLLPPEHMVPRQTTEAVCVGGTNIPAGAVVEICLAAANRDPTRFADPAALRLERRPGAHLSFAGGAHRCIGAGVALAHTASALAALFRVAPRFQAVQPLGTVRYLRYAPRRAIQELVITR